MNNQHEHKQLSNDPVVRGHETSDADPKSVAMNGLMLSAGLVIAAILVSWLAYSMLKSYSPVPESPARTFVAADSAKLPPIPRLQQDPHVTLVPFVQRQDSLLATYGWVSKDSGIVRIPVERAMQLVVEKGLPVQSRTSNNEEGRKQ